MSNPDFDGFYITSIILLCIVLVVIFLLSWKGKKLFKSERKFFILWNAILSISLIYLFLFVGETYFRFYMDRTDSFDLTKISQRWKARHYQINNANCRDNITYYNKIEQRKRRISIFGDSFTIGQGIKNIDDRFSNILRQNLPKVEIHNVAKDGASSASHLVQLKETKENDYELDIVILAYCMNDIDYLLEEGDSIYKRIHAFNKGLNVIEKNSYFINWASFRLFAFNDPDLLKYSDFVKSGYQGLSWSKHKTVLQNILRSVYEQNGRIMVVTFPFLQHTAENYPFREEHQKLDDFWKSQNIPHLDLLKTFESRLGNDLVVNEYDAHPNELANKLAADAIIRFINTL